MPDDVRARQRTGTGLGLLLALVLGAVLLTALPDHGRREGGACTPHSVSSWSADDRLTGEFARYGDDATRDDDWTGGDGTHSVRSAYPLTTCLGTNGTTCSKECRAAGKMPKSMNGFITFSDTSEPSSSSKT